MSRFLLTLSFVIGAVFGNLLVAQYWWRSAWRDTVTGHVLLALFGVIAFSYNLTVVALLFREVFTGGVGLVVRIVARFAIDAVLIGMYVLLVRAQRRDRALPPEPLIDPPTLRRPPPEGKDDHEHTRG